MPTAKKILRVYLDSSDYSVLSDPRRSSETMVIRTELQQLALTEQVEFWYSAAHISEMAPLEWQHSTMAAARAACLSDLCQQHALVSMDKLLEHEYRCLVSRQHTSEAIYSYQGDWFPDIEEILPANPWLEGMQTASTVMKENGLNRKARRKLNSGLFKHQRPTEAFRAMMAKNTDISGIVARYPMRDQDAITLARYFTGHATRTDAEEAFLASLRDPKWMMQWFYLHHDKLSPIKAWARGSAPQMIAKLREAANIVTEGLLKQAKIIAYAQALGIPYRSDAFDDAWWLNSQHELVTNIVFRASDTYTNGAIKTPPSPDEADLYMPGLATCIRLLHSLTKHSLGPNARKPKESDWVDCIHAMYAPYVDVFRADAFMTPPLQHHVSKYGVTVVGKLRQLPAAIAQLI